MSDRDSALRACLNPNPIIDGRKANVNLAYLGAKPRSNQLAGIAAAAAGESHLARHCDFHFDFDGVRDVTRGVVNACCSSQTLGVTNIRTFACVRV